MCQKRGKWFIIRCKIINLYFLKCSALKKTFPNFGTFRMDLSIKKFDGTSNPVEWLEYIISKFDEMNFSMHEKHKSIPDLLRGKPLIWYSSQQDRMPNFLVY